MLICFAASSQHFDNGINFSANLGIGPGAAEVMYDVVSQAPGNENSTASFRSFRSDLFYSYFSLRLGYNFKNFGVGGHAYLGTLKDSNVESVVINSLSGNNDRGRVLTEDAQDWPNNKNYVGFYVEYNQKIGKTIYVTPRVEYLFWRFSNKDTFIENSIIFDSELAYNDIFVDRSSLAFSFDFKFMAKENQYFQTGLTYFLDSFDFSQDYVQEEMANVQTSQYNITFNVGYGFLFEL